MSMRYELEITSICHGNDDNLEGYLNYTKSFKTELVGDTYFDAIQQGLVLGIIALPSGHYLCLSLDDNVDATCGLIFTITSSGEAVQGIKPVSVLKLTTWPPK